MSETATTEGTTEGDKTPEVDNPLEPTPKTYDEAYVKELRQEAAAARVAKKDAVDAAVAAVKQEYEAALAERDTKYTELENELGKAWIELEKLYTTIDAKVPSEKVRAFVAILQGSDKESISESAKSAYELAGGFETRPSGFDPSHGFGGKPKDMALNGDPILEAIKQAVGIQ